MSIRFYFLRKQAKDKESAKKIFLRLEKERLDLQRKIAKEIASDASFDHLISLRHKDDAYDEILHDLAEVAGLNYAETEIGRFMRQLDQQFEKERRDIEFIRNYNGVKD